jgi:phosphoribosylformylglycinamidine synthase
MLEARGLPVADVQARACYFVGVQGDLPAVERNRLIALLDDGRPEPETPSDRHAASFLVVPRPGTISPWASKATDIAHHCGLPQIIRIERAIRYTVVPQRRLLASRELDAGQIDAVAALVHDRMTQSVVAADFDGLALFASVPGEPVRPVPVMAEGRAALSTCNERLGLALMKSTTCCGPTKTLGVIRRTSNS